MKRAVKAVIRAYQWFVSPIMPPRCIHVPTCSHYTLAAIDKHGFWRGAWLGIRRLLRCHPFARGGYDPVP